MSNNDLILYYQLYFTMPFVPLRFINMNSTYCGPSNVQPTHKIYNIRGGRRSIYERWTHTQLALQRRRSTCHYSFLKQTHDKRKRKQTWDSGGLQAQKVGMVGNSRGVELRVSFHVGHLPTKI